MKLGDQFEAQPHPHFSYRVNGGDWVRGPVIVGAGDVLEVKLRARGPAGEDMPTINVDWTLP